MEIGDTIEAPQENEASLRTSRRQAKSTRGRRTETGGDGNPSAGTTDTLEDRTARRDTRKRNGSTRKSRSNGNGGRGGGGNRIETDSDQQLADLLAALRDLRDGDFSTRLSGSEDPLLDDISSAFNGIAERTERLASEAVRVSTTIGP